MIRSLASFPIAANMSANRVSCSDDSLIVISIMVEIYFDNSRNTEEVKKFNWVDGFC